MSIIGFKEEDFVETKPELTVDECTEVRKQYLEDQIAACKESLSRSEFMRNQYPSSDPKEQLYHKYVVEEAEGIIKRCEKELDEINVN